MVNLHQEKKEDEPRIKGINAFVLMFIIILVMSLLTYILPAGQYERVESNGRMVVDPESFQYISSNPVGFLEIFNSVHLGMLEGAPIILFVFLFGGALGIMQKTGAIDSFIKVMASKFGKKEYVLIPILVLIFASLGTLIGSAEDTLVYIAIIIPLTMALGMDAMTGFAIVMLGTLATGFTSGITNPFNIGVAQTIAELPMYSGMSYRIVVFAVFYILTVLFIYRHAKKVKSDQSKGIYGKFNPEESIKIDLDFKISTRHLLALLVLLVNFVALIVGVIKFQWYISEIGGIFLLSSIIMSIICKIGPNKMAEGFIMGARDMVEGALIIGFAQTILVITTNGGLIDTILHFVSNAVSVLPASINAVGMFLLQLCLNFLVPSGSGQAALTMPIMTPLADLIGVTRQTAVLAFQFGDGISNMVIPTSGVLLAGLAIAGIPFSKWVRWVFPYFLIQTSLAIVLLVIAHLINYGPF
ncbi:AbgT family transporter [Lysinibacillus fusiformis]|uniref:YfcC family protein n=1 Tax=Lysinibacillus fusiformis TaxID=28031 RepID=UPI001F4EF489|nr:AbgT family transporter [Lysinibacillus fusiformis]MCK1990121.1 AbgT family transporter [Lysinibacillus fusiformis]